MKYSVIFSFLFATLFIAGCRKSDNPKVPDLTRVPLPLITLAENAGTQIPGDNPATFATSFIVDVYFKHGELPKQFDIVVVKNGDVSNPKTILAGISTFPTTINLTGQQLIDLFGSAISLGDKFEVGADVVTKDDVRWLAFPPVGTTYAPGIANQPGSNTSLMFAAPCLFEPALYTEGDYEVIVDEWADYASGDVITVKKIDDTHYSFEYAASDPNPIIMIVNPADNSITVEPTMYGNYGGLEVTATGVPGQDSQVDPCDLSFSVKLNHVYSGGNLGDYIIKLRKL